MKITKYIKDDRESCRADLGLNQALKCYQVSCLSAMLHCSLFPWAYFLYGPGGLNGIAAPTFCKSLCSHPKRALGLPGKELIGSTGVGFLSLITS